LKGAALVPSTSEAMRQIKQGAVRVDGARAEMRASCFGLEIRMFSRSASAAIARVTLAALASRLAESHAQRRCTSRTSKKFRSEC
jgi:hypothetical protein